MSVPLPVLTRANCRVEPSARVPEKLVVVDWLTVRELVPAVPFLSVIVPPNPLSELTLIELAFRSSRPPMRTRPPEPSAAALPTTSVPASIVVPPE